MKLYIDLSNILLSFDWGEILLATKDTLFMLVFAILYSSLIGIPLGLLLFLNSKKGLLPNFFIYSILSFIVNILRSIPFIIIMIIMIPVTTFFVGTSLGAKGAIPPLVVGAFPFFARLVENSLNEIDQGVLDMAKSYSANIWQIVWYILLPEILPSLIANLTVTAIALISYTAMAGAVGGGGLGDLAIRYGYQRYDLQLVLIIVLILIAMVQLVQVIGNGLVRRMTH